MHRVGDRSILTWGHEAVREQRVMTASLANNAFAVVFARSSITLYVGLQTFSCDSFPEAHSRAEELHRRTFSSNGRSQQTLAIKLPVDHREAESQIWRNVTHPF
jgi:hypothetical protein